MKIISGKLIAEALLADLKSRISSLPDKPVLVDFLVGSDPVSVAYTKIKSRAAERIGVAFHIAEINSGTSQDGLIESVSRAARDPRTSGIIVQLPLPAGYDRAAVLKAIAPALDIDCIGEENLKLFYAGSPRFIPPAVAAVARILETLNLDLSQKNIAIIGQGELVGRPLTHLLRLKGCKVSTADKKTGDLREFLKDADIVVSAAGQGGLVKAEFLKKHAVVIDAGTSESGGTIIGDVEKAGLESVADYYSPVPGGVGPVTVSMLYSNLLQAHLKKRELSFDR